MHRPGLELDRLTPANAPGCCSTTSCGPSGPARSTTRSSELLTARGVRVHHFATLLAEALATESAARSRSSGSAPTSGSGRRWPRDLRALFADTDPAGSGRAVHRRHRRLGPAARWAGPGWSGRPRTSTTSCCRRCPTRCSSATTPPGSATARPSTRWPCRPGAASRCTPAPSTATTRCSPAARRSSTTTATTTWTTRRPPSRAATSTCSPTTR